MVEYGKNFDVELLSFLKESDNGAFMEIYDRYNSLLFAYAYRKLQDKQESQDVWQDVFITLWEKRGVFILNTYLKYVLTKILDIWKQR